MEQAYWIGRMEAAWASARAAAGGEAKLQYYEMAGLYSVKAGGGAPFMLPRKGPATEGEREALRRPGPRFGPGPLHQPSAGPPPRSGEGPLHHPPAAGGPPPRSGEEYR